MSLQDDDEEEVEDSEFPDDTDVDDDDAADAKSCPICGESIFALAQRCPHCGNFISAEHVRNRRPLWIVAGVVLCLVVVFFYWLR